jgi:hypothetical protein
MNRADLMVCPVRASTTGDWATRCVSPHSKKIHVDIDRSSVNKTASVGPGYHRRCRRRQQYTLPMVGRAVTRRSIWLLDRHHSLARA